MDQPSAEEFNLWKTSRLNSTIFREGLLAKSHNVIVKIAKEVQTWYNRCRNRARHLNYFNLYMFLSFPSSFLSLGLYHDKVIPTPQLEKGLYKRVSM